MAKKGFVNSSWTAANKVPKKSARGVVLDYGVNAFETINAAKTHGCDELYVADKTVKLTNLDGITMISAVEPYAVEEYKTKGTTVADVMQVKLAPANEITIKADPSTAVLVQGYKKATIDGIDPSTGDFTVVGGTNAANASYSYAEKGANKSYEWKGSLKAVASGDLDVKNVAALTIEGLLYDYSYSPVWVSETGEADINFTPNSYNNVTLKSVQGGADFSGGNTTYAYADKRSELDGGSYSSSWKYTDTYAATGKLVVGSATVGNASEIGYVTGYSDVTIDGDTVFGSVDGYAYTETDEYNIVHTEKGGVTAETISNKYSDSDRAAGKASFKDITAGGNVYGYATVTVTDSILVNAYAGNAASAVKYASDHTVGGAGETLKISQISSQTYAENGSLTASGTVLGSPAVLTGDVIGFNKITLKNAEVDGVIAAADDLGRAYNRAQTMGSSYAQKDSGDESENYESKRNEIRTAAGTVTVSDASIVSSGVTGYSSVSVKDSEIAGEFVAGNIRDENNDTYKRSLKGSNEVITQANTTKYVENANGTLTVNTTSATDIGILDFQNVTLNNVDGTVTSAVGGTYDSAFKGQQTFVNGIESVKYTRALNDNAAGSFAVKNADSSTLAIGNGIVGFNKVSVANTVSGYTNTVTDGIAGGNYSSSYSLDARNLEDPSWIVTSFTSLEDGSTYDEGVESRVITSKLTGSVDLDRTYVAGDVTGYATVTLANGAIVDGNVNTPDQNAAKMTQKFQKNVESRFETESYTADTTLNLKKVTSDGSATAVTGDAWKLKQLTLEESATIGGTAEMVTSTWTRDQAVTHASKGDTYASKYAESRTAAGTVNINQDAVAGAIYGAKTVNVKSATVGDLEAFNTTYSAQAKGLTKEGDVLTIDGGIMTSDTHTQYEETFKYTESAVGVATLNSAVVSDFISGFNKVTATDTDLNCSILGGKEAQTWAEKYSNVEKNGKVTRSLIQTDSSVVTAQGAVTATRGLVGGAYVSGFQTVTFSQVEDAAGAMLGGNRVTADSATYISVDDSGDLKGSKTSNTTSVTAVGSFTAVGVSSASDPVLSFATISGFNAVKITSANVDSDIDATTYVAKTSRLNDGVGLSSLSATITSKYAGSVDIGMNVSDGSATVGGDINGFAKVTLDDVVVAGGINRSPYGDGVFEPLTITETRAVKWNSDGTMTAFTSTLSSGATASVDLTLKNGAVVQSGFANHVSKLTMGPGTELTSADSNSIVTMFNSTFGGSRSIELKGDAYNGTEKGSRTRVANGTVVIAASSGTITSAADFQGVKSFTATSAIVGNIEGWNVEAASQRNGAKIALTTNDLDGDGIIDEADWTAADSGSSKTAEIQTAKGQVTLTDTTAGYIEGAATVTLAGATIDGAYAFSHKASEQWNWTSPDASSYKGTTEWIETAVGTFTATDTLAAATVVNADVYGFAKVELDGYTYITGDVVGGNYIEKGTYTYGSGTYVTSDVVAGSFLAEEYSAVGGNVSGYAKVTVADEAMIYGDALGGNWVRTYDWAWTLEDETLTTAGDLTVNDGDIYGAAAYYKTATFEGENIVGTIYGVSTTTVKNGVTLLQNDPSYVGLEADETVTVEANGTLQAYSMDFGDGNDTLSVAGTVAILNDAAGTLTGLEKLTGNGLLAVTDSYYTGDLATDLAAIDAVDAALTIVDAGGATATLSIRTKAYELGDNSAGSAQVCNADNDNIVGWLNAETANGFVDDVDWISFNYDSASGIDYTFTLTEDNSGGAFKWTAIKGTTEVTGTGDFTASGEGLADGNWQLKLELTSTTANQVAYTFVRA